MTERKMQDLLMELLFEEEGVRRVDTFADDGLLTRDKGVVVKMDGGAEFQITIVQSRRGQAPHADGPEAFEEED